MNKLKQCTLQATLFPAGPLTADENGAGIDVRELVDNGKLVLLVEAVSGTTPTCDARIQDCDTIGGTYADLVPALAFTQIAAVDSQQAIDIDLDRTRGFIRIAFDTGGTTPVYEAGCVLLGRTNQDG